MTALRHVLALLKLTLPFPLSMPHGLVCHFPDEAFFELEEAPSLGGCLFPPIQADQEEIGQDRQRDRARHPLFVVRHLHLAQVQPALEFLYGGRQCTIKKTAIHSSDEETPPIVGCDALLALAN